MGNWEWNIKDNTEKWSDDQFRIFGYEPGEIEPTYDHFIKTLHPDDRNRVLKAVERALNNTTPYNIEFRIIRSDMTERTVLAQGEVYRDEHNNPARMTGTITDITRYKSIEKKLLNSHRDLQRLAGCLISNQEKQLRHLARELHDDLTQKLAVMAIETGNIEKQNDLSETVRQKITGIKDQLIKISKEVHNLSRNLHPSILEDLGLERSIRSECSNFSARMGIAVIFQARNVPAAIPNDIALSVYRIVQEGLSNIAKHAKSKNAYIFLEGMPDRISITISDTGVGFDPLHINCQDALGLVSMRERSRLVNGRISVNSRPGKGTSIEVSIPLKKKLH